MNGEFKGGTTVNFDIKNEGVGIPAENPNLSKDIQDALNKAVKDIKDGKVKVSTKAKIKDGNIG